MTNRDKDTLLGRYGVAIITALISIFLAATPLLITGAAKAAKLESGLKASQAAAEKNAKSIEDLDDIKGRLIRIETLLQEHVKHHESGGR